MITSDISSSQTRPISSLGQLYYRQQSKTFLEADATTATTASKVMLSQFDPSSFEFPGDMTYERYLQNRSVV